MSTKNGAQPDRKQLWAEIMAQVERWDAESKADALEQLVSERVEARLAELERAKAPPLPRRSEMSAQAKSRYIRANGLDAYNRLPWS